MASFHYELKSGRNGYEHARYIAREGFHSKREDLVDVQCGNLPEWAEGDVGRFWKAADSHERKNGAVYRESIVALPVELTVEQNKTLARDIITKLARGKPYQAAIHAPSSSIEKHPNPHLHLMVSDRMDDGIERDEATFFARYNGKEPSQGGRRKDGGGSTRMEVRDALIAKRRLVAETINHHLGMHGFSLRVDHRKLSEQGLDRKAERHLGPMRVRQMAEKEKVTYVAVRKILR